MPYFGIFELKFETLFSYLKSAPSNLSTCRILLKKPPKFVTKNALFWYFWAKILKSYFHILNQHTQICQIANLAKKEKILKLGSKICLNANYYKKPQKYLNLGQKMRYLGIFGGEF